MNSPYISYSRPKTTNKANSKNALRAFKFHGSTLELNIVNQITKYIKILKKASINTHKLFNAFILRSLKRSHNSIKKVDNNGNFLLKLPFIKHLKQLSSIQTVSNIYSFGKDLAQMVFQPAVYSKSYAHVLL